MDGNFPKKAIWRVWDEHGQVGRQGRFKKAGKEGWMGLKVGWKILCFAGNAGWVCSCGERGGRIATVEDRGCVLALGRREGDDVDGRGGWVRGVFLKRGCAFPGLFGVGVGWGWDRVVSEGNPGGIAIPPIICEWSNNNNII
jgi:hypothetical protein